MNLTQRDQKHIWHPLTQHKNSPHFLPIVKAKGSLLYDEDGNSYIDGIASWYTSMYGHCNDQILRRVHNQMQQLDQIVFAGFTHQPAIDLSELLISILPSNQNKIFFSDNGSTANEVAIKMALQYHFNKGQKRKIILAFENGFHGDTFGAMSASGLSVYNGPFEDLLLEVIKLPTPNKNNIHEILKQLNDIFISNTVAAFIYEPLVQGANSMHIFEAELLNLILKKCKKHDVICIADEVMTGFGKTGKNFASEYIEEQPDIITLSKALTAGLVPMAITSCTDKVYNTFLSDNTNAAFFHAHTYTANPIACSAAIAGIELLKSSEIQSNIKSIINDHKSFNLKIQSHKKVEKTRQIGVIFALDLNIEMARYGSKRNQIFDFFMEKGIFLRPLGNTIYILPAYTIKKEELSSIYKAIENLLDTI